MKPPKHDLRALQEEWYKKLEDSGFRDVEKFRGSELVLKHESDHCYTWARDPFVRVMKEEYYRIMAQYAQDEETYFKSETDRHILNRHAEGVQIKVIVEELEMMGWSRNRKSVRSIIKRYRKAWGYK